MDCVCVRDLLFTVLVNEYGGSADNFLELAESKRVHLCRVDNLRSDSELRILAQQLQATNDCNHSTDMCTSNSW